jgi:protein-glutamine gamma-glutamyltransferase
MVRIKSVLSILTYSIALLGFIPLFPYLEPLARVMFPVAFLAGVAADRRGRYLHGAVVTVAALIFFGYYALRFSRDNPVAPAANLVIIFLAIRLFSEKSGRNYLQVFALALFALAASSLYNLSAVFLVYLVLLLVLLTVSLVILTFYGQDSAMVISAPDLHKIFSIALVMPAVTIPLMLVFFVILPRTPHPLWNVLNMPGSKVTGFTETVQPGTSATVGEVKNVAFRAESPRLPVNRLYWRGIVLNSLAGDTWVRKEPPAGETYSLASGPVIRQTVYPEPGRTRYLVALNIPRQISGIRVSSSADHVFSKSFEARQRIKYDAISVLSGNIDSGKGITREFYLQLPDHLPARLQEAAEGLARRGRNDGEKLALLENFFLSQRVSYATTGLPVGPDSLDEFLFGKKRGHCELFASATATMLRLAGIPARLVGGYLGGVYNDMGGYYTVSEDMAHVWVEAYIGGRGWQTVDPSRWGVNFADVSAARDKGERGRLKMYLDALGYFWNRAVISYDLEQQIQLISSANLQLRQFRVMPHVSSRPLLLLVVVILLVVVVRMGKGKKKSPEERIISRFLKLMGKNYRLDNVGSETGLFDLAKEIDDPRVHRFVSLYGTAVYHDRGLTAEEIRTLLEILKSLKKL